MKNTQGFQGLHDGGNAARTVEILDVVASRRSEVAEVRGLFGDVVCDRKIEVDPALVRDRGKVEHGVRRATERHVDGERVFKGFARHDVAGLHVLSHEVHHGHAGFLGEAVARAHDGGNRPVSGERHPEDFGEAVHGVRREHPRAGPAGGAGLVFDFHEGRLGDAARIEGADRFGDVGVGEPAAVRHAAREHGARRNHDRGDVEATRRHQEPRHVLVAGCDEDEPVEGVGRRHRFDAVGDQFAAHERILHPGVSHGETVADGDRGKDDGGSTRHGDALLRSLRHLVEEHVPRNDFVEGTDDPDQGSFDFGVAKAERLQNGPLRSRVIAFRETVTAHDGVSFG